MDAALLDLTEVEKELSQQLIRTPDETARAGEKLGVRQLLERKCARN